MKTFVIGDVHGRCAQLRNLLDLLPRDETEDSLIFLGDLIDRGFDAPGCVDHVIKLSSDNPERTICLRGNHEQMLLDFIDGAGNVWLSSVTGGERTYEQYTNQSLLASTDAEVDEARHTLAECVPVEHLEFFRQLPYYHEDDYALYVHAGWIMASIRAKAGHTRCSGHAILTFTKTILASSASLVTRSPRSCPCAAGWDDPASIFSTA